MSIVKLPDHISHGSITGYYTYNCRCEPCRKIGAAYAKGSRAKGKERNRAYVDEMKSKPCTDCGGCFPPVCMHFDHLGDKEFEISWACARTFSLERIKLEIEKCELVCANCHAIRTERRRLEAL
jgi:hypothetical protein